MELCEVRTSMCVCVRVQDIFVLAEVMDMVNLSFPWCLPPLPSTPLLSTPLLSTPLPSTPTTALSKGFRVKTFLIKDTNTFPVKVRVMSSSVMRRR